MLLEVGHIDKPHGLKGEVVVSLTTTEHDRVAVGSVLFTGDRPLEVLASQPHQHRWVVTFAGVSSREDADSLRGALLSGEVTRSTPDDDELWVHELIGAEVVGSDGTVHGHVEALQENPASDLLVLDTGALVPLRFATRWIVRGERLEIDPPTGLFDLDP